MTTLDAAATTAALTLPRFFSDHMVLQRQRPILLWGGAAPGATVQASIAGAQASASADQQGQWRLQLPALPAGGPYELLVTCGSQTLRYHDVCIGDVWVCSGQSNMAMNVAATADGSVEAAAACDALLRVFSVGVDLAARPQRDVNGQWRVCEPSAAGGFSAVAYYFGKFLRQRVGVPIGLMVAASGHTPAQAWMSRDALQSEPQSARLLEPFDAMLARELAAWQSLAPYRAAMADDFVKWNRQTGVYLPAAYQARLEGRPLPPLPKYPSGLGDPQNPTVLFNAMIAPLTPLPIRGVIWYQGETNALYAQSHLYRTLFPALIRDWRNQFQNPDLPFLYVQLANHACVQCSTPRQNWPELREAQLRSLRVPQTAMAVIIDIGESGQIHPRNKREVGRRLALAALAKCYGQSLTYSGPIYRDAVFEAGACRVRFDHADGGLVLRSSQGFELAGADQQWKGAQPRIEGDGLVLHSAQVPQPVACRYAWDDDPPCTLFNGVGLPASPFRSDDWPRHTQPR